MSAGRFISLLACTLALSSACHRPSEPEPGPGTTVSTTPASSAKSSLAPTPHSPSVHDRDIPDDPPPHPPPDNATLIKASHILIAYKGALDAPASVTRNKAEAEKLADFVGREARAGADFGALVAKYSDDLRTRADDGRLGQISRTQMAKPFTDAAFALLVKEITLAPVETAYGFHIIKRTE